MNNKQSQQNQCIDRITKLENQVKKISVSNSKPWYKSASIWFSIVLIIVMLIIIYVFYLTDKLGYGIVLPEWMK